MTEILECLCRETEAGRCCVLAAVAERSGSAPRGAGALMAVGSGGYLAGSVGGGAVEQRALELAEEALRRRSGALHRLSLSALGMLCGGEVTLLLTFVPAQAVPWQALLSRAAEGGGTLVLRPNGAPELLDGQTPVAPELRGDTLRLPLVPRPRAVLFGAGHCGRALTPILASVGFAVTVYDDRPAFADAGALPDAARVICGSYDAVAAQLEPRRGDYVVIMTAGHASDLEVLSQALRWETAYIGLIGSAKKRAAVAARLAALGFPPEAAERVHTPIGLPILAVSPAEIAVSIAAELIRCRAEENLKKQLQSDA